MSRPRTGNLRERRRADGTVLYTARVMAYGNRETVIIGDEREGMTRLMARRSLRELVKDIELGIWEPPSRPGRRGPDTRRRHTEPPFAEAAAEFVATKRAHGLADSSIAALGWALDVHLVPYFGTTRPSRIDERMVAGYIRHQVERRDEIRSLRERGLYLTGPRGGAMRELSNQAINSTLRVLHSMLGWRPSRAGATPRSTRPPASGSRRTSARPSRSKSMS